MAEPEMKTTLETSPAMENKTPGADGDTHVEKKEPVIEESKEAEAEAEVTKQPEEEPVEKSAEEAKVKEEQEECEKQVEEPEVDKEAKPETATEVITELKPDGNVAAVENNDGKEEQPSSEKEEEKAEKAKEPKKSKSVDKIDDSKVDKSDDSKVDKSDDSKVDKSDDNKKRKSDFVSLRLLLGGKDAGRVIGRKGGNIKKIRKESKAKITKQGSYSQRILTAVGSKESVAKAITGVCRRLGRDGSEVRSKDKADEEREKKGPVITLCLLVHTTQCGAVIGRGGAKMKEIAEMTNASIRVSKEMLPNSTERPVLLAGTAKQVTDAVQEIMKMLSEVPARGPIRLYQPQSEMPLLELAAGKSQIGREMMSCHWVPVPSGYSNYPSQPSLNLLNGNGNNNSNNNNNNHNNNNNNNNGNNNHHHHNNNNNNNNNNLNSSNNNGNGFPFANSLIGSSTMQGLSNSPFGMGRGGSRMDQRHYLTGSNGLRMPMQHQQRHNALYDAQGMQGNQAHKLNNQGKQSNFANTTKKEITIPQLLTSAILGRNGTNIREIRKRSGARVEVSAPDKNSTVRMITIKGAPASVGLAETYIIQLINAKIHDMTFNQRQGMLGMQGISRDIRIPA